MLSLTLPSWSGESCQRGFLPSFLYAYCFEPCSSGRAAHRAQWLSSGVLALHARSPGFDIQY